MGIRKKINHVFRSFFKELVLYTEVDSLGRFLIEENDSLLNVLQLSRLSIRSIQMFDQVLVTELLRSPRIPKNLLRRQLLVKEFASDLIVVTER